MPTIYNPAQLLAEAKSIFDQCAIALSGHEKASHLAYRTNSTDELRRMLGLARCFGEEIINEHQGRKYHWIMLHKPLEHGSQRIIAYEFPAPEKDADKPEGFYACVCVLTTKDSPPYNKATPKGILLRMLVVQPEILLTRRKAA